MRKLTIILAALTLITVCGCQKEVKEIRNPNHAAPALAQR